MFTDSPMIIDGKEYTIIADGDDGEMYEWHTVALMQDKEGNFYVLEDAGCSCNFFGDYVDAGDLEPVASWQAGLEIAKDRLAEDAFADFAEEVLRWDRTRG